MDDEFVEDQYFEIHEYDEFCTNVLKHSVNCCSSVLDSVEDQPIWDSDLLLKKIESDNLPPFGKYTKLQYDPKEDLKLIPMFELKDIIERFIEIDEYDRIIIKDSNLKECCRKVSQRVIWGIFELGSREGICETLVKKDGTMNYRLKNIQEDNLV